MLQNTSTITQTSVTQITNPHSQLFLKFDNCVTGKHTSIHPIIILKNHYQPLFIIYIYTFFGGGGGHFEIMRL